MKTFNAQKKIYTHVIPVIYYSIVVIMIGMIIVNIYAFGDTETNFGLGSYQKWENGWVDGQGTPTDFNNSYSYRVTGKDEVSIFHTIDFGLEDRVSVIFRTKNTAVEVFLSGERVYGTQWTDGPFYNRSPGTRWNVVNVDEKDAGKIMEIRVKLSYKDERSRIDEIYVGDSTAILIDMIDQKGSSVLLCFLMFVAGISYYIAGIVLNYKQKEKDYSLMYLASFATISAVWCLIETNILQLFFDNIQVLQVVDNMMLVIGGMPLFLYMDGLYGIFRYKAIRILCVVDLFYVVSATVCHIFGWFDYHQTLSGMFIAYVCIIVVLGFCLVRQAINMHEQRLTGKKRVCYTMQQLGMGILGASAACDLVSYILKDSIDRAVFIRIGLVVFILFFGFGNIYRLIELVKHGLQTELIHGLAYTDGLTGVGNRTAYIEHLEQLVKEPMSSQCGIVIFDINDLKDVNDIHGHTAGDNLIKTCAQMIEESFAEAGRLYRIGGDEFAMILSGVNVKSLYEHAVKELQAKIEKHQAISIAYGASFSSESTKEKLHFVQMEADKHMYENKKRIKMAR